MNRHSGWRAAALTLLTVVATGCADAGPIEPAQPAQQSLTALQPDLSVIAQYRTGVSMLSFGWASTWIGPQGGSLRLLGFEIVVPAGAVTSWTRFTIKLPLDWSGLDRAYAEFLPHNVPFAQPVTLRLPYRGTTAENETPGILWWDGSTWVRYPTTLRWDGRIETTTTHFSEFGTEDPERGITPVGG